MLTSLGQIKALKHAEILDLISNTNINELFMAGIPAKWLSAPQMDTILQQMLHNRDSMTFPAPPRLAFSKMIKPDGCGFIHLHASTT